MLPGGKIPQSRRRLVRILSFSVFHVWLNFVAVVVDWLPTLGTVKVRNTSTLISFIPEMKALCYLRAILTSFAWHLQTALTATAGEYRFREWRFSEWQFADTFPENNVRLPHFLWCSIFASAYCERCCCRDLDILINVVSCKYQHYVTSLLAFWWYGELLSDMLLQWSWYC